MSTDLKQAVCPTCHSTNVEISRDSEGRESYEPSDFHCISCDHYFNVVEMSIPWTETRATSSHFTIRHADDSISKVTVGKKARYLIPYMIKSALSCHRWLTIEYQGMLINEARTLSNCSSNCIVTEDNVVVIF